MGVVVAVILIGLLVGLYAALRLTPLSAVENVTVVGVVGPDAREIRRAIEQAAIGQSTLAFDAGALRDAVRESPSITGIDAHPRFPHGVQVEVHQRVAVGALSVGGRKIAVATDGTLLPEWAAGKLPVINAGRATGGRLVAEHRVSARVLAAAPGPLQRRIARVDRSTIVRLASGPALLFHDGRRLTAKWAAAVAVLADPTSAGATWIDLHVPERPVAGRGAPPPVPGRSEPASDLRPGASDPASTTGQARDPDVAAVGQATAGNAAGIPQTASSGAEEQP